MAKDTALRVWVGFTISLLCILFCGRIMSFNVYSVDLKEQFNLTQTQVEIAASGGVLGGLATVASAIVIHRYGYRACYLASTALILSSGAFMWMASMYKPFFGHWIGFVSLFLILGDAACYMGKQCCSVVGLQVLPSRHSGKILSCYVSILTLGKVYYSGIYELFFQASGQLGLFFLISSIPTAVALVSCSFLHMPNTTTQRNEFEHKGLLKSADDVTEEKQGERSNSVGLQPSSHLPLREVFRSGFVHLAVLSAALVFTCSVTFLNNATLIALSAGISNPLSTVYLLSVSITLSRLTSGFVYDRVNTTTGLAVLLLACHFPLCMGMFIGLVWLNDVTIYVICALNSIGMGTVYLLIMSLLNSVYGSTHLPALQAYVSVIQTALAIAAQLTVGITFDNTVSDFNSTNQQETHFFWAFLLLTCVSVTSLILLTTKIALYIKPQVPPTKLPWKLI